MMYLCHPYFDDCGGIAESGNVITVRFRRNYTQAIHPLIMSAACIAIESKLTRKIFHWQILYTASKCIRRAFNALRTAFAVE